MRQFLLGVGSPLVDYSAAVPDDFLTEHVSGSKGGTLNITDADKEYLSQNMATPFYRVAGGAAANTVMAAAELGVSASLFGKLGNDENGSIFRDAMRKSGASDADLLTDPAMPTGYCLTLVTPDAERTMRSNLAASANISVADAENFDFSRFQWILLEGYFIGTDFFEKCMIRAREAGCKIAVDLCSFELAAKFRDRFIMLLKKYAGLLFANSDEASALTGKSAPEDMLDFLNPLLPATALKLGASGSIIDAGNNRYHIPSAPATAVDTTAAGDYYAAGFFYGLAKNMAWDKCGYAGSLAAAEIVTHTGTKLPEENWNKLKKYMETM